eukprot:Skav236015  [mRNA]  locus=scaffold3189:141253:142121:- [translate_table: standard]
MRTLFEHQEWVVLQMVMLTQDIGHQLGCSGSGILNQPDATSGMGTSCAKEDYGVDTLKITDDDAAFILGKGGKTKEKIAKVAEASGSP